MIATKCIGWWQQAGLGRQPMDNLLVAVLGSRISGSGTDMIAPFTLDGRIHDDGIVELVKQYEGRHSVLYVGIYDGEGTLSGTWDIDGFQGEWSIRFQQPAVERSMEIKEI